MPDPAGKAPLRWDAHACVPLSPVPPSAGADLEVLDRHRRAGFTVVSLNVGMDMTPPRQVIDTIARFRRWLECRSDRFVLARSVEDVAAAHGTGRLAVVFDVEGAAPLLSDESLVQRAAGLGLRQAALVYNRNNAAGGGCHDDDEGLTRRGRCFLAALNAAGIVPDCSHAGERTSLDVMEASTTPVVFSHANARALVDHPRNVTDRQIDACAATGGVVGVCGFDLLLGRRGDAVPAMAEHVDHIVQRVGPDHVGLGLDHVYEAGADPLPPGIDPAYWWPPDAGYGGAWTGSPPDVADALAEALAARGYGAAAVSKILGGNFLDVARRTWRVGPAAAAAGCGAGAIGTG
ncbi:dipeptidase [Azospirillum oleiclasticum]|uniref:Membrane dipeptidase n=1 Tax=Azospirillum oleiclasticum TaxID=2735135 RepID=A0ABX2T966_9PROT|nr:membrane dipeptidase [Azospirillum oleiclasticum]NYZ20724.1 membrane dipeptidase [Azospirillum oleiclasticum]